MPIGICHTGRSHEKRCVLIQLTDAIRASLEDTELRAVRSDAHRFDCGSPGGFLEATAQAAMADPELAERMLGIARDIVDTAET